MQTESNLLRVLVLGATLAIVTLQSGCATVEPWQREQLAKPEMALDGNAVTAGLDDHIYFSKESSSGGRVFGGGGCGCN